MIAPHHARIVRPIDAGDAETDRGGDDRPIAQRLLHHFVEDLLDFELADGLGSRLLRRLARISPSPLAS